jgi:hypothetical protein
MKHFAEPVTLFFLCAASVRDLCNTLKSAPLFAGRRTIANSPNTGKGFCQSSQSIGNQDISRTPSRRQKLVWGSLS